MIKIRGRKMKYLPLIAMLFVSSIAAAAGGEFVLVIQDHRFQPEEIVVPAGKKVKLLVENRDASSEEFESHALNREKVIAGKSKAAIFIGPLAPGRYPFVGEFHEDTAHGVVIAR